MDLKKYLTQVQDFATDLVSRNNLLNDLYQEVIEMMLHDDKEPPKEAVVLKVLPNTQTADELKEGNEQYYTAVLRIPKLHDCLPDPARKIKNSTNGEINKIIQCHTVCFSREKLSSVDGSGNPSPAPKVGDVVVLDFVDGVPRFGAKIRYDINYTGLSFLSENSEDQEKPATSSSLDDQQQLQKKFKENESTTLGDFVGPPAPGENVVYENVIDELEGKILITQELIVYPSSLNFLTKRVTKEYKIWKNKKEKDPTVYETLKKYWDNIGWNEVGGKDPVWTPSGVPWSAAYISWIVKDKFFPKAASHYKYSYDALNNRETKTGKWWLFSLKREKIKINIGDIFVKTRSNGTKKTYYASHGDMVWKIEKNIAYLTGGNVGDTMKTRIKIRLNEDGTPKSTGKYIILVKRVE